MVDSITIANIVLGFAFLISILAVSYYGYQKYSEYSKEIKNRRLYVKRMKQYVADTLRKGYDERQIESHLQSQNLNPEFVRRLIQSAKRARV